jgi:hypothetical protein
MGMISTLLAQTGGVHTRSALFDRYRDHLRARGWQAPVSALVRLPVPLDSAAPAVRYRKGLT